jgi:anti-anti-sigma factor
MSDTKSFSHERAGDALFVVIHGDVGSLADAEVLAEFDAVAQQLRDSPSRKVVLDFSDVEYFGSSVLEGLRLLWRRLDPLGAKMALCGLSDVGVEILQIANFDRLWPICSTRAEALERLKS